MSVLEKLVELNAFDVPQGMIDEQLNALVDELRMRQAYMGRDPKQLTFSDAEMADLRQRAEFAARASCVLDGVARQEGIEVSDADLDAKIQEMADERGQPVEAIRGYIQQEGASSVLKARIQEEKTLDWLLENAKVTKVEPKADESADTTPAAEATSGGTSDWNKSMKKAELLDVAKGMGLEVTTKMTKPQIIEALENA